MGNSGVGEARGWPWGHVEQPGGQTSRCAVPIGRRHKTGGIVHFHAEWKSRSDVRPMELLAKFGLERFTTVEFLPFGPDWTHVAEIRFSENKDLPDDNDLPRRQKVRNSTVEVSSQAGSALARSWHGLGTVIVILRPCLAGSGMAGSEDAGARSCHSPTLAWRPFPTQSQPSTCTSLVWAPTDTPHGQQFCDGAAKDHESGHGFPPRRRCDLQYMGYDHQRDADQHHDGRDHESPSELRLPVHHMNQVTTRATVHRNVTSVVVQPRKFVKRPLVLAPTTFRLLV